MGVRRALHPVQVPRTPAPHRAQPSRPAQPAGPVPAGRPAGRTRPGGARADPADGRGVRLSLTAAGRALQRQIGRRHARSVARAMTAGLTRLNSPARNDLPETGLGQRLQRGPDPMSTERFRLVVVSAGTSDPSSTRLLADRAADRVQGPGGPARPRGDGQRHRAARDRRRHLHRAGLPAGYAKAAAGDHRAWRGRRHHRRRAGLQGRPEPACSPRSSTYWTTTC